MATLVQTNLLRTADLVQVKKIDRTHKHSPRRCMVVSVGMIIAGVAIPLLMVAGFLPLTVWLGGAALFSIFAGGIVALIFCGEL